MIAWFSLVVEKFPWIWLAVAIRNYHIEQNKAHLAYKKCVPLFLDSIYLPAVVIQIPALASSFIFLREILVQVSQAVYDNSLHQIE